MPTQAQEGSGRLRRSPGGRPQAASGSPQDGSGMLSAGSGALGYAPVSQARSGTLSAAQARLSTLRQAQTCSGAQEAQTLKRHRHAQRHWARSSTLRQARTAQARSGMLNDGSGTLRQVQASSDTLRRAQTPQKLSDRLRYARVAQARSVRQARSLRQAQDGTTHKHAQTLKTRSGRLKQQAQASTGSSRRSGRLKRAVRQARVGIP
jgi:hypothetical protein